MSDCDEVPCIVCGKPVGTCEFGECADKNPAHRDGCQMRDERWVCSDSCWERAAGSPDYCAGEICRRCKEPVGVVWAAPDELWWKVTGGPGGIMCVRCFSEAAQAVGVPVWFDCRKHTAEPCIPVEQVGEARVTVESGPGRGE